MNPLSQMFSAGVALRNALYDRQALKSHKLRQPVVSVGNISVGGSGKTPFVIALGQLLKERGVEFDVLSRGYGRKSKDISVVDPQGAPHEFGDEPLLIARALHVPVIVGADRYQGGLLAERQFSSRMHLLDDGFQHRRLHRSFDIVLLPEEDMRDTLLPVGRLREPLRSLARADAVVLPPGVAAPAEARRVWRTTREIHASSTTQDVVAFCGIARPEQFFEGLRNVGKRLVDTVAFPDHHRYAQADIDRLIQRKLKSGAVGFVTTEKDAINLGSLSVRLEPLESATLTLRLEDPQAAVAMVLEAL
ncbi:MAG TPA: tetraacyldisaccharide 4'-kinase [Candidatus Angelobacter sp.]|nr:tetraacyldisaccharide 4'-kinase [Candidatus Angelobacter sp.]